MKSKHTAEELLVGKILFPTTNALLNRRHILKDHRSFLRSETWPEERIRDLQEDRLKTLLRYVWEHVPFYRQRMDEAGVKPADIRTAADLKILAPVTRQEVIDRHHEMVDRRYVSKACLADQSGRAAGAPIPFALFKRDRLVRNTSSGSTGAPTVFYEDGARTAMNWAHELRLRSWFGIVPGAREARMARVSTDYMPGARDLKMRRRLWNQLILPGVNLGPEDYHISYEKLKEFRPRVMWGFTSALAGLADFIREEKLDPDPVRPELVITWAAPLYEHEESVIKDVLKCQVTNIYGAREVGHIAMRCPEGNFHINEEYLLVEEEGSSNGKVPSGELLVTTLDLTIMPFLRYRMGDLGRLAREECACGRSLLLLKELLGRTGEIFRTRDGRMISPNFWCRTFMNPSLSGKITRFQVVYRKDDEIEIRIVRGEGYNEETEKGFKEFLAGNFSGQINVYLKYVDEIRPQISGKYQMVVNELNN
jgi:phenylacetate-CoA ligase